MRAESKLDTLDREGVMAPPARGRLWYDDEIPGRFFHGRVTVRWIREHLPRNRGLKIGRDWAWYEADILDWLEARRGARMMR